MNLLSFFKLTHAVVMVKLQQLVTATPQNIELLTYTAAQSVFLPVPALPATLLVGKYLKLCNILFH